MASEAPVFRLDASAVARAFGRASSQYESRARLQHTVRTELLERLELLALRPRCVVDLGAGTGQASAELKRRYGRAQVLALDLAPGMLQVARRHWRWWRRFGRVCADARRLPLADQSVDLLFSNLMLQWCDEPSQVFTECRRVLRPGGVFAFSTFGPDTLQELRAAWASADASPHVSAFADASGLGGALLSAGFDEPVLDVERYRLFYPDTRALMGELQDIGARNAALERRRTLTGPRRLAAMSRAYEAYRERDGVPATYEVIFANAFGPQHGRPAPAAGEALVPLGTLRRHRP